MANRRPNTSYTADSLVRRLPGWKPPKTAGDEPAAEAAPTERIPLLPEFKLSSSFNPISKNAMDSVRQQQLEEINSIREYLARPF